MKRFLLAVQIAFCLMLIVNQPGYNYPYDGYALTGIRRLERLRWIIEGKLKGTMPVPGARKLSTDIRLNLPRETGAGLDVFPEPDPELQTRLNALFPNRDESYSLAIMDITPGRPFRYAKRQERRQFSPGSVGKLAVVAGLFTELSRLYPDAPEKRRELLRNRMVIAGQWIRTDSHTVPFFNPGTGEFRSRVLKENDVFSLYEWTDHMLSASANAAASVVWKEVILMRAFGLEYPPDPEQEKQYFQNIPKNELRDVAMSVVNDPLRAIGIKKEDWQLGSFFTDTGQKIVPGGGGSLGTPFGLLQFLVALERGLIVDAWSSLETKRLMYMTARRIRYASSPALDSAAVYFKSGSLYRCKPEEGFVCKQYMGNVENVMNSVAIVEHPDGRTYLVSFMSNILKKNSAIEHQTLATYVDRITK